jgi:hypothetical protein
MRRKNQEPSSRQTMRTGRENLASTVRKELGNVDVDVVHLLVALGYE